MSCIVYCHIQEICHMNIKPENILFINPGPIKDNPIHLTGFGLSQNLIG